MNYAEPEIPLFGKESAVVVFAPNPADFVMQLSRNLDELTALMEDISSYCNSGDGKPLSRLRPGTACIARYSLDGAWYRARVESVSVNAIKVYFVDYGNYEDVPLADVLEIMPQFMSLPAQGIRCNLMGARPSNGDQWPRELSESFLDMTEGKDLQTVFVQKKGKVVDVIIDDITDPAGVSINEQFGVTFEVLRDALPAINIKTQQVSHLDTISNQDSSAYKLPVFSPQTRLKVLVSWFVTPEEFYCQNLSSEKDFKDLMDEIQRSNKELSPLRGEIGVGTAVIAKFPADGVLYRGEIKEKRGGTSYLVEYVDYGNNEIVSLSNLWTVEPHFRSLPRHAFLCSLEGVKPIDSKWSRNANDYINIFGADNLECVVSEMKNGKYSVSLFLGDKNVAAELVQHHLAEELQGPESEDTQFDLVLLPGQQFAVHIAFIESITKFYVHLDPVIAQGIQDIVAEYVQNTEVQRPFPLENLEKYSLCLATPDGAVWYRAKILDVTSPRDVLVSFIDYGDTSEVPLDQMLAIPETLADYFPQATECFISGSYQAAIDAALEEQFKEMEAQNVIIFVDSLLCGRLGVQVFDLDGMRLEMLKTIINNPMLMVEPVCPMPVRNYTASVWVSHVDGLQHLWLQYTASEEQLIKLLDLLHKFYETDASGQMLDSPEGGHFCAAKSCKDDGWYRAKVKSVGEDGVSVLFIDYGNSETVPFESLRELDPSFFTPHILSLCASLCVVAKDEDKCMSYLTELVSEKVFSATFVKDLSGAWLVDLLDGDNSVSEQLLESGLAVSKGSSLSVPDTYSIVQLPIGKHCSVFFSYFESPSEFYVQPASLHDDIANFQKNLNDVAASLENLKMLSVVGILCAAQFSVDFQWYRALIMESNAAVVKVRFVDYGNIDEIDTTYTPLKILPNELKSQPFFAVRCSLNAESLANNKEVSLVEDLALNQEQVVEIEVQDGGDPVTVRLVPSGSVAPVQQLDMREQEVCGEIREDSSENINQCSHTESISGDIGDKSLIWHVTTPAEFWIQDNSVSPLLDEMAERLAEAASFPVLESIDEGLLCAALFPEDELWYRASILKVINDCACVRYIDYGNSSLSTQLRALPMDLVSPPPLAKCCQLMLPDTIYPRSLDRAETVELRIGANGDPVIVKIKTEEEEEAVLVASEDVAELDGSNEVTICHATSPTSFWVHFTQDMPLLDEIAGKLVLCESYGPLLDPAVGTVCAALFPEDGQWYRAEILSCSENGIEVIFIDYGNSSLSTDLRCLPIEVSNIPRVAKHCCLILPEAWTNWPLTAEEKFLNISGDDSKSFQITILREGNPAGVSLRYDGILVEDEILKDCQPVENSDYLEVNVNSGVIDVCMQKGEKVLISHINSLADFWIQKIALQSQLDEMAEELASAESFGIHFPRLVGLLCAARYEEDLNWYRARVINVSEQGAEVLFIDYGNKSLCSELRSLPSELAAIPPLAKHCNLVIPEDWTEWPKSLEEEFLDTFQDGSKICELTVLFEGDPSLVSLVHEEVSIENILKRRYEDKDVIGEPQEEGKISHEECEVEQQVKEEESVKNIHGNDDDGDDSVVETEGTCSIGEEISAAKEETSESHDEIVTETEIPGNKGECSEFQAVNSDLCMGEDEEISQMDHLVNGQDREENEFMPETEENLVDSVGVDEEITLVETDQEPFVIEESSAAQEIIGDDTSQDVSVEENQVDSVGVDEEITLVETDQELLIIEELGAAQEIVGDDTIPDTSQYVSVEENQVDSVGVDEEITLVETDQELLIIEELGAAQEIVGDYTIPDTSQDVSVEENQVDSVGVDQEITLVETDEELPIIEELNAAQEIIGDDAIPDTSQDVSVEENQVDSVEVDEEITLVETDQELFVIEELSAAQEIIGDDTIPDTIQDVSVEENQVDSVGVDEEITLVETDQELLVIEELSTAQEIIGEEPEKTYNGHNAVAEGLGTEEGSYAVDKETSNNLGDLVIDEEITLVEGKQEVIVIEEVFTAEETKAVEDSMGEGNFRILSDVETDGMVINNEVLEDHTENRGAEMELTIEETTVLDTENKTKGDFCTEENKSPDMVNGDGFLKHGEEMPFAPGEDTEKDIVHITYGKMFPPKEKIMLEEHPGTSKGLIGEKRFTNADGENQVSAEAQTLRGVEKSLLQEMYCAPKLKTEEAVPSDEVIHTVRENGVICRAANETKSTRLRTSQQPIQSRRLVAITHALSPKDFWVRYKNKSLLLDDITLKLANAQAFDPLLIAVEGTLCVALCSENEPFQRGKVVRCHELNTEVFFLDSGKTAVCTKLFCLPEGMESTPPLAKHCCLTLPENWNVWPPAANSEFVNIIEDDSQDFELIVLQDGDPAEVSLLCNGKKIENELMKRLTSRNSVSRSYDIFTSGNQQEKN